MGINIWSFYWRNYWSMSRSHVYGNVQIAWMCFLKFNVIKYKPITIVYYLNKPTIKLILKIILKKCFLKDKGRVVYIYLIVKIK